MKALSRLHLSQLLMLLGGLAVFGLSYFATVEIINGDFTHTLLVSQAILEHQTVQLDAYKERVDHARHLDYNYRIEQVNGHYYYLFPIGPSLLLLPVVWIANLLGRDMAIHEQEYELIKLLASISSAVIFVLVYKICTYYLKPLPSLIITLISVLGSSLISTLGVALWNMHFTLLFILLSLLLLVRYETGRAKTVNPFLLGLFLFLSFLCRPTTTPFILLIFVYVFIRQRESLLKLLATSATLFLMFVGWCWWIYGQALPNYYLPERLVATPNFWEAFYGNAFSPARGLFIFNPFLILLFGILIWFRPRKEMLFWLSLGWFVLHYIAVSRKNQAWWGGHQYGPRLLIDGLPALILMTVLVWQEISRRATPAAKAMVAGSYLCLGLAGIFINTYQGLYNPNTNLWNKDPNIDRYPEYLFDWNYPQFLASEASLQRRRLEHQEKRLSPYAIGNPLGYDSREAVFWGWSESDIGWRWTQAQQPRIVFKLDGGVIDPNKAYKLEILCGAAAQKQVEVRLNEVEVGYLALEAFTGEMPHPQVLEVPGALFKENALNRIDFYLPDGPVPTGEAAHLADIAFVSLKIVPAVTDSDQVDYFEGEFFESGFSHAEKGWRWTDGPAASLHYPLGAVEAEGDYTLEITSGALGEQPVGLVLNGTKIGDLTFVESEPQTQSLRFSGKLLRTGDNRIDFMIPKAAIPEGDSRQLGLAFVALRLYRFDE